MTTYTVLTTFNNDGYHRYGQRMIQTFLEYWPVSVQLLVYAEDTTVQETASNLRVIDLHAASPELVAFKQRWQNVPRAVGAEVLGPPDRKGNPRGIGFKWDAVRFSHKIYAVCHAARHCSSSWLIWMDADCVTHSMVPDDALAEFCPLEKDLCFLGRTAKYSECGLYALNLGSDRTRLFLKRFQAMYDHAENGIFRQHEWHDSFIFDRVRESITDLHELDWAQGLVHGEGHPLISCEWGRYLDHLKGKRKDIGHSLVKDIRVSRPEQYWQNILRK